MKQPVARCLDHTFDAPLYSVNVAIDPEVLVEERREAEKMASLLLERTAGRFNWRPLAERGNASHLEPTACRRRERRSPSFCGAW